MEFYSRQDLQEIAGQLRRLLWRAGLPSLLCLAALVASLAARMQWLTVMVTLAWGGLVLFFWDMKVSPVLAYRRHVSGILSGLRRTAEGRVVSFSEEGTYKDGVFFDTLIINVDPRMDPEGERLFLLDRCKQRPSLAPGDFVRVAANGNFMTAWEK